jgi:RNA polymerase sigma-70 factor (ECF subfamily)
MSTTAREAAIAAKRVARERSFFEALARRFYTGVYNYLCWISRDAGLAEDLTQETFMQIWQHPPEMRGERALKAWVFRVARNEYLQHRRRAGLDTMAFGDCAEADLADVSSADPQLSLEREDLLRAVRGAVEKLPDQYREVIVLHNLEGLSLGQIAEVLEIPVGTVKSRRAKALSMLRHLLQEVGNDEM